MMKILTVVGARPQFVKAAVVSKSIQKQPEIREVVLHTGQHYDHKMSGVFFEQMQIPAPEYNLDINQMSHGKMTGRMLEKIEDCLMREKPDLVLVYGDTNSTLAAALAAKKMHIKIAHVEAGLRSFNDKMPEEINRILTDRMSDLLFCPTTHAIDNLKTEGFNQFDKKILITGDVMYDAALYFAEYAKKPDGDIPEKYALATVHRAENTNDPERLAGIFKALREIAGEVPIVLPLHPGTKNIAEKLQINFSGLTIIEPVSYFEMIYLLQSADCVFTDSGGMQKEAFFFEKPCITLREETEWVELVEHGYNKLACNSSEDILTAYHNFVKNPPLFDKKMYGEGNAAEIIVEALLQNMK
ncbi:MAG: non-hydrolyzing UDP-N-acetylglucosamine 2-epimerase [Bacteroidales bacterium]